ncbi:unnamed protein product, partial [Closterium sp. NIES-53]
VSATLCRKAFEPLFLPRATHSPHTGILGTTVSRAPYPPASLCSRHSHYCKRNTEFAPLACFSAHWVLHAMCASLLALLHCPCTLHAHSSPFFCLHRVATPRSLLLHQPCGLASLSSTSHLTTRNSLTPHRDLGSNSLTGSIPDSISTLTALEFL